MNMKELTKAASLAKPGQPAYAVLLDGRRRRILYVGRKYVHVVGHVQRETISAADVAEVVYY